MQWLPLQGCRWPRIPADLGPGRGDLKFGARSGVEEDGNRGHYALLAQSAQRRVTGRPSRLRADISIIKLRYAPARSSILLIFRFL